MEPTAQPKKQQSNRNDKEDNLWKKQYHGRKL